MGAQGGGGQGSGERERGCALCPTGTMTEFCNVALAEEGPWLGVHPRQVGRVTWVALVGGGGVLLAAAHWPSGMEVVSAPHQDPRWGATDCGDGHNPEGRACATGILLVLSTLALGDGHGGSVYIGGRTAGRTWKGGLQQYCAGPHPLARSWTLMSASPGGVGVGAPQ